MAAPKRTHQGLTAVQQRAAVQLATVLSGAPVALPGGLVVGAGVGMAAGATLAAGVIEAIVLILGTLGLGALVARRVAVLASGSAIPELPFEPGPVAKTEQEHAPAWLALYLVHAAERLTTVKSPSEEARAFNLEQRYFQLHLAAEERRMRSALHVDLTAVTLSDRSDGLLGWYGILDDRTTPECRWAIGRNFVADKMPVIGPPGGVHISCRCTPGPSRPGAPLIPSV